MVAVVPFFINSAWARDNLPLPTREIHHGNDANGEVFLADTIL